MKNAERDIDERIDRRRENFRLCLGNCVERKAVEKKTT